MFVYFVAAVAFLSVCLAPFLSIYFTIKRGWDPTNVALMAVVSVIVAGIGAIFGVIAVSVVFEL